jgi:hypothetical protein
MLESSIADATLFWGEIGPVAAVSSIDCCHWQTHTCWPIRSVYCRSTLAFPHDGNVPISADHDFSATDSKAA